MSRSFRAFVARLSKFPLPAIALLAVAPLRAQATEEWRSWNRPVEPFRIAENLYSVGAGDIASFLVTTPAGHVIFDGGFVETAPQILANVRTLGFDPKEVRWLLLSHAHFDHAGGLAELARATGAKVAASAADAVLLEDGGASDFALAKEGPVTRFPKVAVARRLADGDTLALGGTVFTAHLTPGHTKGATTWTWKSGGLDAVLVSSASILDYRLVGEESYPGIAADFERTFATLRNLPCDLFLAPHTRFFDLEGKRKAAAAGAKSNPFVDPAGYRAWVESGEKAFREAVARQRAEASR